MAGSLGDDFIHLIGLVARPASVGIQLCVVTSNQAQAPSAAAQWRRRLAPFVLLGGALVVGHHGHALDLKRVKSLLSEPILIDLRNIYPRDIVENAGFTYIAVGR